jgi:hypothetical protein
MFYFGETDQIKIVQKKPLTRSCLTLLRTEQEYNAWALTNDLPQQIPLIFAAQLPYASI